MNNNKVNYVIVGGFVLAMLAGLIVSLALLTGRTGATDGYSPFIGTSPASSSEPKSSTKAIPLARWRK